MIHEIGKVIGGKISLEENKVCGVDTSRFNEGDRLYLSSDVGELTNIQPKPEIGKRVLAYVEGEEYPFVGYWDGSEWLMEVEYLNCDTYDNSIFGEVEYWMELPSL